MAHHWRADWLGRRIFLKVRVAIDCDVLGIFKGFEIWRYIDIQKFAVDEQETLRVRQTGKLREIVGLNLRQSCRANLGHPRGFVEGKIAYPPRLLKFFTETFNRHDGGLLTKRRHRDRPKSRVVWRLRRDPKYRAAPEYQRCAQHACSRVGAGAAARRWRRVFPAE